MTETLKDIRLMTIIILAGVVLVLGIVDLQNGGHHHAINQPNTGNHAHN